MEYRIGTVITAMMTTVILIVLSISALMLFFKLARGRSASVHSLEDLSGQTHPVDIEAFRNLIDPAEEEFLRSNLSPQKFRAVRRERLRATLDYVQCASHNAAVLLRLGEGARESADPRVAQAAQHLIDSAIRLRLNALLAMPKLYLGIAIPGARLTPNGLIDGYQQLSSFAGQLALTQNPARAPRLSTVL